MSTSSDSRRLPGVQSRARSSSTVNNRVWPMLFVGLLFSGGVATAAVTNVLVNPGAENGLSGWHVSDTGYIYPVSTNALQGGAGSAHILAHSGTNVFQLFDTTANSAFIYQDFPAAAGSIWSASCSAICYASNYFNPGASAHMQVAFFDVSNNVVASTNSSSGSAGILGSDFLDPSGSPDPTTIYWIFAPPMAVDTNGWVFLEATNLYNGTLNAPPMSPAIATEQNFEVPLSPITTNIFVAPSNTAYVRYQLEFDNTSTDGGAVYFDDCALIKVAPSDPDITNQSGAVTVYPGSTVTFSVNAIRAVKPEVLAAQWQKNGINMPPTGGSVSGTTTNISGGVTTLIMTNVQVADAGLYSCLISDTNGSIRSVPVPLTVLVQSPIQKRNLLGANSGFESNPTFSPWNIFNGCYFATAANFYGTSSNAVNVFDGTSVALTGANGDRDNGFWQSVPVPPGTLCKAGGYAYISSSNDFVGGNTCRLQIWFKDGTGATLNGDPTYESFKMYGLGYTNADTMYTNYDVSSPNFGQVGLHDQLPRDQWVYLTVSNVVNNNGIGLQDDLPYNTLPNGVFAVPNDAAQVNFQAYEYCPVAADNPQADLPGVASDSVYWDDMGLFVVEPVTNLAATVSANNINLKFPGLAGLSYTVVYKTNLTDPSWNVLANNVSVPPSWATNTTSTGDSYPIIVSDSLTAASRFYRVISH